VALALALGLVFFLLNVFELAFRDGSWSQIVTTAQHDRGVAIARRRGLAGVAR
jgi:hypothetical protein